MADQHFGLTNQEKYQKKKRQVTTSFKVYNTAAPQEGNGSFLQIKGQFKKGDIVITGLQRCLFTDISKSEAD